MFKRVSIVFFLVIIPITTTAFAGNIPDGILMNPQQGILIGKIIETSDKEFTIELKTVMVHKINDKKINIKRFHKYYGTNTPPKRNDYIVAKLISANKIDEFWIFKATSDNYKTLKLVCNPHYDIVLKYQKHINNGDYFKPHTTLPQTQTSLSIKNKSKISKSQYIMISLLIFSMLGMCIYSYHNKFK